MSPQFYVGGIYFSLPIGVNKKMKKYRIGVIGLMMGRSWVQAAKELPETELSMVYDKYFNENGAIDQKFYSQLCLIADKESDIYSADLDIIIVASPDHFHAEQCIKAMEAGKHVICEKPLAGTVKECKEIIAAVKRTGKHFMTGQVCRYAPGFKTAKLLINEGRIGDICFIESEYAHDYNKVPGFNNWRNDPKIKREGFIGGGCHALDLVRWLAGDPTEVFCYTNRIHMPSWPTDDTGVSIMKFPSGAIGKVFVSIGVKRPYTMRTVINGTKGSIICDNTSDHIQICEASVYDVSHALEFAKVPVSIANHNVAAELADFIDHMEKNESQVTDVYQGTKTVAVGEAALESARTGRAVKINYNL
jgi:myo-inositol 2-dehydrogenase/D-chiro-inositol 1-dehydrogenase